jgi:D-lyxose ketol-isomerase
VITKQQLDAAVAAALKCLDQANIAVTPAERTHIEVADFGLGRLDAVGLQLLVYLNTDRCCAKELVLFPGQICPEHRHPPVEGEPGKEETFRCRWGEVYLYLPGAPARPPRAAVPADVAPFLTVWREVVLKAGEQCTLPPDTLHWFQGGPNGAVVSEFSTKSRDDSDIFTDPRIERTTRVEG